MRNLFKRRLSSHLSNQLEENLYGSVLECGGPEILSWHRKMGLTHLMVVILLGRLLN